MQSGMLSGRMGEVGQRDPVLVLITWKRSGVFRESVGWKKNSIILVSKKTKNTDSTSFLVSLKQITGIEPASPAWEASILPMNYICMSVIIIRFS